MHAINAVYESSYGMGSDLKIRSAPRTASKWSGPDRGGYQASTIWTRLFWHHFPKVEDENLIYLYRWRIREQNENPKNRERGLGDGEPGAEAIEVPVPIQFLVPVLGQDPAAEDDANKGFKDLHDGLTGGHFSEETTTHKILRFILFYSAINRCPLSLFWVKSILRIHFPGYFLILYLAFVKAWPCIFSLCKSVFIFYFLV